MADVYEIWDSKVEDFVTDKIEKSYSHDLARVRVLESAVKGRIYYAAVQRLDLKSGIITVSGLVCIADLFLDNGVRKIEYKPISESSGPSYTECPLSILELLTSPPNKYAAEWRMECIKAANKPKFKVAPGDVVVFGTPLETSAGKCAHFFIHGKEKAYWMVSDYFGNGPIYRIKNALLKNSFDGGSLEIFSGDAKALLVKPEVNSAEISPSPSPSP